MKWEYGNKMSWKGFIIFAVWIMTIFIVATTVKADYEWVTLYDFTFDGGSTDGYLEYCAGDAGNPDFTNNDIGWSGGAGSVGQDLNLTWDMNMNFTFLWTWTGTTSNVNFGFHDLPQECASYDLGFNFNDNDNKLYIRGNYSTVLKECAYTPSSTELINLIFLTNGTWQVYTDGSKLCTADLSLPNTSIQANVIFTSDDDNIDNILIQQYQEVAASGTTPAITLTSNLSTGNYTTDLSFNTTGSAVNITSNLFNCSLYLNNTLNDTVLNYPINNSYIVWNLTYGNQETSYDINVTCERYEGANHVYDNLQVTDVFIDSIPPVINISTNIEQYARLFQDTMGNQTLYANVSDNNLAQANFTIWEINLTGGRGSSYVIQQINSSITSTLAEFTQIINFSGIWNYGTFDFMIEGWDDHTTKTIPIYDNIPIDGGWSIDNELFIYSNDTLLFELIREPDRYKFKMKFQDCTDDEIECYYPTIVLESPYRLEYRKYSGYEGHFICYNCGSHGRWIDFQGGEIETFIKKISDYEYHITLLTYESEIEFESVGDMNYVTTTYRFNTEENYTDDSWEYNITNTCTQFNLTTPVNVTVTGADISLLGLPDTSGTYPANVTVMFSGNYYAYNHTGTFVGADLDIDLNKTYIKNYLESNPNITMTVCSDGTGILNAFDYSLTYTRGLELNFDSSTTGKVYFVDSEIYNFTGTTLGLNYTQLTDQITLVSFNNDTQVFEFWTDADSTDKLEKNIHIASNIDDEIYVQVSAGSEVAVEFARVELSEDNQDDIVYAKVTNEYGEATLMGDSTKVYDLCVYKEGYTTDRDIACKKITTTDFGTTIYLKLESDSYPNYVPPADIVITPNITGAPAGSRLNMTFLKSQIRNSSDQYSVLFVVFILSIIIGIVFENRITGTGVLSFGVVFALFASVFSWIMTLPLLIILANKIINYVNDRG